MSSIALRRLFYGLKEFLDHLLRQLVVIFFRVNRYGIIGIKKGFLASL